MKFRPNPEALLALLIGLVAFGLRFWNVGLPPLTSESLHYSVARTFGQEDPNLTGLYPWYFFQLQPFLWARPVFYGLLWPFAQVSVEASQFATTLVSSTGVVILFLLLRRLQVPRAIAIPICLVGAGHPALVLIGARVDPYPWVATAILMALLAQLHGRPLMAALLLASAIGCDRLAMVAGVPILIAAVRDSHARTGEPWWPIRLDRQASAYAVVMALAPVPLVYSALATFNFGARSTPIAILDASLLHPLVLLFVMLGLFWRDTRRWAVLGLTYPAAFLLSQALLGRTAWNEQMVPSAMLALLAGGIGLSTFGRRFPSKARGVVRAAAILTAALLVLPGFLDLPTSLDRNDTRTFADERALARTRATWLEAAGWLEGSQQVFLVDLPFETMHFPFHESAGKVRMRYAYSNNPENITLWVEILETPGVTTLVLDNGFPLNRVVRAVYEDCVGRAEHGWTLIHADRCPGRRDRLIDAFMAELGAPSET